MASVCRVETPEEFEQRVVRLQAEFAAGDAATRRRLLQPAHAKERFENYDPEASSLADTDARLLIANHEGYAYWGKYESYLHLDPAVQRVIVAVRSGDIEMLRNTLRADPAAANPRWVAGYHRPTPIPNDSIPLFCVSEGVFRETNTQHNAYDMTRMLIAAGADMHIEGDIVLESAVSFDVINAVAPCSTAAPPSMESMAMVCRWPMQCISASSKSPSFSADAARSAICALLPAWVNSKW